MNSNAKHQIKTVWLPIGAAIIAYSIAMVLKPAEHLIMSTLPSGSIPNPQAASPELRAGLQAAFAVIACCAAYYVGLRASRGQRAFALGAIFLSLGVIQFSLWDSMQVEPTPLGTAMGLFIGVGVALFARHTEKRELSAQAKHYELLLQNEELQDARIQIVKQDEVDRRSLAADLHDQVLNDLKAIKQGVNSLSETPNKSELVELDALISRAIDGVREVMDSLSPSVLEHLGLPAAVEDYMRRNSARAGFKVRFRNEISDSDLERLNAVQLSLLYRLAQEAVNNVAKHANASTIKGSAEIVNNHLKLTISDDGKGIDPALIHSDSRGLRFMRQRADLMGATIAWLPGADGKGTQVEILIELTGASDAENSDH